MTKLSLFCSLLLLLLPVVVWAQGGKVPTGKAAVVPKTPTPNGPVSATSVNLPPGGLPGVLKIECQMRNGKLRSYPCEFRVTSMGIGGGGTTLKDPSGDSKPYSLTLSVSKATQNASLGGDGTMRMLTFSLALTVPRVNAPSFAAPSGGYQLIYYPKDVSALISDVWKTGDPLIFNYVTATEPMAINVGQTQVLLLPIKFTVQKNPNGTYNLVEFGSLVSSQTGKFYFINQTTLQAVRNEASTQEMRDLAEWWAKVTFVLVP